MNKKIAICLVVFILTVMFGSKVFADRPAYSQTIHVTKGWYLLGSGGDFNTDLMPPATSIFAYLPVINRYFHIKPRLTDAEQLDSAIDAAIAAQNTSSKTDVNEP